MMENKELVLQLNKELATNLPEQISLEELQQQLTAYINELIRDHFEKAGKPAVPY